VKPHPRRSCANLVVCADFARSPSDVRRHITERRETPGLDEDQHSPQAPCLLSFRGKSECVRHTRYVRELASRTTEAVGGVRDYEALLELAVRELGKLPH
jgi:hypothetical protein